MNRIKLAIVSLFLLSFGAVGTAVAAETATHKVVIQVSSSDPETQNLALNNVANVQQLYGMDNVTVELVAYGPGLSLLTKQNKQSKRVESLAMQNVTFSACGNTIKAITKKTGKKPVLTEGVRVVPGGVGRIIELQEQGYSYIRP